MQLLFIRGQWVSQVSLVKNPTVNTGDVDSISRWRRSPGGGLEEGMRTHSSIFAWRIPWGEEPGRLQSIGLQRVRLKQVNMHACIWQNPQKEENLGKERKNVGETGKFPRNSQQQFSSIAQSCLPLCDPMDCSMPGIPFHCQLPEFTQTHVHWVGDAIQPSHPLSSPSPPDFNLPQHQGLF